MVEIDEVVAAAPTAGEILVQIGNLAQRHGWPDEVTYARAAWVPRGVNGVHEKWGRRDGILGVVWLDHNDVLRFQELVDYCQMTDITYRCRWARQEVEA